MYTLADPKADTMGDQPMSERRNRLIALAEKQYHLEIEPLEGELQVEKSKHSQDIVNRGFSQSTLNTGGLMHLELKYLTKKLEVRVKVARKYILEGQPVSAPDDCKVMLDFVEPVLTGHIKTIPQPLKKISLQKGLKPFKESVERFASDYRSKLKRELEIEMESVDLGIEPEISSQYTEESPITADQDYEPILLEQEQRELLVLAVEASRNVPREEREKFIVLKSRGGALLMHHGLSENKEIYNGDVEVLSKEGLLNLSYGSKGSPIFDVSPLGFRYYEFLKKQAGEPVEQVKAEIHSYIDSDSFKTKHPMAYSKWQEAQKKLWASESEKEWTVIGHLCREAIQEFADVHVDLYKLTDVELDKAKTINRIKAVLKQEEERIGETYTTVLNALLEYWEAVNHLIQRQEHLMQYEITPKWEDARRVTFQTLIVMYEIDKALS